MYTCIILDDKCQYLAFTSPENYLTGNMERKLLPLNVIPLVNVALYVPENVPQQ